MRSKEKSIKYATILIVYLFVVWGLYRFLFKLPEEPEELLIKPLIWLLPVLVLVKKEGSSFRSLGLTTKNMFPALYLSLAFGAIFAIEGILLNSIKHGSPDFSANIGTNFLAISLAISFVTAFTEELTFRGYIYTRLRFALGNPLASNILSSVAWGLIHVPFSIFWLQLDPMGVVGFFLLMTVYGIGSAFIFEKTENIFGSVLLHVLWSWPIILFR